MRAALAGKAPGPNAPLRDQLAWLQNQHLAFPQPSDCLCFDPEVLATEIGLTVNLTRFEARELHLQRRLESALTRLALRNGGSLGNPLRPQALGVETLAYQTSARMILVSLWGGRADLSWRSADLV